jgi:hypothetical protein
MHSAISLKRATMQVPLDEETRKLVKYPGVEQNQTER